VPDLAAPPLSALETEVIDVCVRIAQFIGLPKSNGEIFGLLFASPGPLPMDVIVERLAMSKGSASQGLKQLKIYGAVKTEYIPGDRRDHYSVEMNLRKLVSGFMKERVEPGLADLAERLNGLALRVRQLPPSQSRHLGQRVEKLKNWQNQAQRVYPALNKILSG
jgi:DNA-binding transcriptional regulator GbsR (MarR family)